MKKLRLWLLERAIRWAPGVPPERRKYLLGCLQLARDLDELHVVATKWLNAVEKDGQS